MPLKLPSRRVAGLWLAGVLCAAAAGAAVLPARWVLTLLPADAPVTLADASGTLWHGSAWIALGPPGARRVLPQPVQWQWRWDTMALDISHPWLQGALRARPGWNGLALPASSLRVPATVLPALGAPWNTLSPQGMLEINWQPLRLGAPLPPGPAVDVRWRNAATALSPITPVGTYLLRVQGGKSGATLVLSTESGLLDVKGQGGNGPQGSGPRGIGPRGISFQGEATFARSANEADRAALDGLLSTLGRRSGDTVTFSVRKSGR